MSLKIKQFSLITLSLILFGCAQAPKSDFDKMKNFTKTIDNELFFIREVSPWLKARNTGDLKLSWETKANDLCTSGYKTLLYQHAEEAYKGPDITYLTGYILAAAIMRSKDVAEGIILCNTSSLTEEEAVDILIDQVYIIPKD